jgi:pyruvate/2-oxoglutarate dehydrogenase complex dihydrolipoamide acyltransferase (E2) component
MPDLVAGKRPMTLSVWLVEPGQHVVQGDRLVEILLGPATVDLPAPVSGLLVEICADEEDTLVAGQLLGIIVADEESPPA